LNWAPDRPVSFNRRPQISFYFIKSVADRIAHQQFIDREKRRNKWWCKYSLIKNDFFRELNTRFSRNQSFKKHHPKHYKCIANNIIVIFVYQYVVIGAQNKIPNPAIRAVLIKSCFEFCSRIRCATTSPKQQRPPAVIMFVKRGYFCIDD
jgi:hypothetical protein